MSQNTHRPIEVIASSKLNLSRMKADFRVNQMERRELVSEMQGDPDYMFNMERLAVREKMFKAVAEAMHTYQDDIESLKAQKTIENSKQQLIDTHNEYVQPAYHVEKWANMEAWLNSNANFEEGYIEIASNQTLNGNPIRLDLTPYSELFPCNTI